MTTAPRPLRFAPEAIAAAIERAGRGPQEGTTMTTIPDDLRAEVSDLFDTVKVLRAGVLRAVERFDELEDRHTPGLREGIPDEEMERHMERLKASGLEAVNVWMCAMLDDLARDTNGHLDRDGAGLEEYDEVGVDPLPRYYQRT